MLLQLRTFNFSLLISNLLLRLLTFDFLLLTSYFWHITSDGILLTRLHLTFNFLFTTSTSNFLLWASYYLLLTFNFWFLHSNFTLLFAFFLNLSSDWDVWWVKHAFQVMLFSVHIPLTLHLFWVHVCLSEYCYFCITKTLLYNCDPLEPHFYIVKLGFTGVYIIFFYFCLKHRLWVLVRTASARRF